MKKILLLICILCISPVFIAQNSTDVETIFNLCVNQAELVPQNHYTSDGIATVSVIDNGILPRKININWFDVPIQFKTETQLALANITAYIRFDSFEILNPRQAKVTYTYICTNECTTYKFDLEFTKYTQFWTISRNKTTALIENSLTSFTKSSF